YGSKTAYALYFVDDTRLKNIEIEYEMSKPTVALVVIDSADELIGAYKESEYAEITSSIERLTENWFSGFSGVFRKLASGRFLAVIPEHQLREMMDLKFNVLEQIRAYTYNDLAVGITLSIGVGRADNLNDSEASARQALDMALGRFFGGVSGGVEKRTKVRTRIVASAIAEVVKNSSNVIVMGHKFSDLDAMGAAIGMMMCASYFGKSAKIAVSEKTTLAMPLITYMRQNGLGDCF
ncbi:MAG: DHH family phosphoesterase, partial [Oscillospiraceae bacterium]